MAFCPHCGKSVTDQASKCLACGKEFEPRAKAARFKGTMMMTPAAAPLPKPAAEPAKEPPKPATPAPAVAAAPAAAPAPRAAVPSKVAKHTMLGTGGMGLAPPPQMAPVPARAPTPAPPAQPPPAAGSLPPTPPAAAAPVARSAATKAAPPATTKAAPPPAASQHEPKASVWDDSAMANTDRPPPDEEAPHYSAGSPSSQRGSLDRDAYGRDSAEGALPTQRVGLFIALGVGGLMLIAVAGYFIARLLGL